MMLQKTIDTYLSTDVKAVAVPPPATQLPAKKRSRMTPVQNRITRHLAKSVATDLQLLRDPERRFGKKQALLRAYNDDCDRIRKTDVEVRNFLSDCIMASLVYTGPNQHHIHTAEETLLNLTDRLSNNVNQSLVPQIVDTDARLVATNETPQLHQKLILALENTCFAFVQNMFATLQRGVEQFIFGRVENLLRGETLENGTSSALQYWYFTRRVCDRISDSRFEASARRIFDTALHLHDVVDAKVVPLPAKGVPQPRWIAPVFKSVPEVFRRVGAVSVLTGNITLERVSVRRMTEDLYRIRKYPMHNDPAIMLANTFVLTGWNPTDNRSNEDLRQWTPDAMEPSRPWHETSPVVQYRRKVLGTPNRPRLTA